MRGLIIPFLFICFFMLTGCISIYKSIKPETIKYQDTIQSKSLCYSYKYDILKDRHNRKLYRKAEMHNIRVVAAEITNETGRKIILGKDVIIKSGNRLIKALSPETVRQKIYKTVPPYMTYFMLYLYQQEIHDEDCERQMYPIGLPIAIGNLIMASKSNKKFLTELRRYNFFSTTLEPGEKKPVIISFYSDNENPLSFELNDLNNLTDSVKIEIMPSNTLTNKD